MFDYLRHPLRLANDPMIISAIFTCLCISYIFVVILSYIYHGIYLLYALVLFYRIFVIGFIYYMHLLRFSLILSYIGLEGGRVKMNRGESLGPPYPDKNFRIIVEPKVDIESTHHI